MSEQRTVSPVENQKTGLDKQLIPWNPYQMFGFVVIATTVVVGIILGINWKRLRKPEWQVITILLSILVPGLAILCAFLWISLFIGDQDAPIQLVMSVPYLALGVNFGYVWALARLQNGAYKVYEDDGLEALAKYEYNLQGAVIFGVSVALLIAIGCTVIFPLLNGG